MALPDYFARTSAAAVQALPDLDQQAFRLAADSSSVGIRFGSSACSHQGRAILEMLVRLSARLYPTISLRGDPEAGALAADLAELAQAINPRIEVTEGEARYGFLVGEDQGAPSRAQIAVGSTGWNATLSRKAALSVGVSPVPFGAAAAACVASAAAFRAMFVASDLEHPDDLTLSLLPGRGGSGRGEPEPDTANCDLGEFALVGAGAIGNAAAWALSKLDARGTLHAVDHQLIDLGNLQRYVLGARADEGCQKVSIIERQFSDCELTVVPHALTWGQFVCAQDYYVDRVLVALDSARDRRAVQASLPRWVANAWTQPGDLGLSVHPAFGRGACVCCLYLPSGPRPSQDAVKAAALGIPERVRDVRLALHSGAAMEHELLTLIAERLEVSREALDAFVGRPIRDLYMEGVCGGAVISLDRAGLPPRELHVPLAPQSALAGVLLSSAIVAESLGLARAVTAVTRLDILRAFGDDLTVEVQADPRGICICQDADFLARYKVKYDRSA